MPVLRSPASNHKHPHASVRFDVSVLRTVRADVSIYATSCTLRSYRARQSTIMRRGTHE